jgi:DNA-binding NtrC family response regulator
MIVDDDPVTRRLLSSWLEEEGYKAQSFSDGRECLEALDRNPGAVCLDIMMEPMDGIEVLREIRRRGSRVPVVMITARDTAEGAVEAMKAGAYDYIVKPIDRLRFKTTIQKAVEVSALTTQLDRLRCELEASDNIIGKSQAIRDVLWHVRRVAETGVNVLIYGESGTGKELVAKAIHRLSPFHDGPFVDINCGAIPENLQESELFGHEKGSFTGAVQTRPGKLELAEGGTLFLDEVSEMSPATQVKLLRFLQDRTFERVGGTRKIRVRLRVISATNRSLEAEVAAGNFREDLYYRLMVYPVTVPPLRERIEDIPLLAAHFLVKFERETGKVIKRLTPEAIEKLVGYSWPGNVRELENVIVRAMIAADGELIDLRHLPASLLASPGVRANGGVQPSPNSLGELEKQSVITALKESRGNVAAAARKLGIGRATCYRKIKAYRLEGLTGRRLASERD